MKDLAVYMIGPEHRTFSLGVLKHMLEYEDCIDYAYIPNTNESLGFDRIAEEYTRHAIKHYRKRFTGSILSKPLDAVFEHELYKRTKETIEDNFYELGFIGDVEPDIIIMSLSTPSYPVGRILADVYKEYFPDTPIIAGGPFFKDDEEIERLVDSSKIDGYCIGHASSLSRFLQRYRNKEIRYSAKQGFSGDVDGLSGFRLKVDSKIVGDGRGKLTILKDGMEVPYTKYDNIVHMNIFGISSCPHHCSYCSTNKQKVSNGERIWRKKIKEAYEKEHMPVYISILDDNPLMYIKKYTKLLERLRKDRVEFLLASMFVDPFNLVNNYNDVLAFLSGYCSQDSKIFIGRETHDEMIAYKMGRNCFGRHRDQKILDEEYQRIKDLINYANTKHMFDSGIVVAYILTPWENKRTISKSLEEWKELTDLGAHIVFYGLTPGFSTRLRKMHRELIRDVNPALYYRIGSFVSTPDNLSYDMLKDVGRVFFR
ncbi:MAG TPA: hypothetical protein ENG42_02150 [Candidatus Aenigmarchaeota archaeon]|nr:hypothetical protein [Candidatus Aenigmarchaeota archaeon]